MNEATDGLHNLCEKTGETLVGVGRKSRLMAQSAWQKARVKARVADEYVHGSPWTLIGAAALIAAAVGYVLGRR